MHPLIRPFTRCVILLTLALTPDLKSAQAGPLCDYYRENSPHLYKVTCTNGSSSTKPAGATSTFTSAFNLNTASLPTEPSSYGLETLATFVTPLGTTEQLVWTPTFAIIKGFHKFGTGISTSSNNTFYGNDILQRLYSTPNLETFTPIETQRGKLMNLNLGTSFLAYKPSVGPKLQLGLTARYNKTSDTWGGGPGVLFIWKSISIGGGFTREKISNNLDAMIFTSLMISARAFIFELEYTLLDTINHDPKLTDLSAIQILSLTTAFNRFTLTVAGRSLNYLSSGFVIQPHYSIQFLFSKNLSGGLLFNHIPGTTSIGLQIYL
jgi:hypothetical protein